MPSNRIKAAAAVVAGVSVIGIGLSQNGNHDSVSVANGESPSSPRIIDGDIVKNEEGESGKSGGDGKLLTESDLGIFDRDWMLRKKIRTAIQQKEDGRTRKQKQRRDSAVTWEERPRAFTVEWNQYDHSEKQPRGFDVAWDEGIEEQCPFNETNCDCCSGFGVCGGVNRTTTCIGFGSCDGRFACGGLNGNVGDGSCLGYLACYKLNGKVGNGSCLSGGVCAYLNGIVGAGSCTSLRACQRLNGTVGSNSCTEPALVNTTSGLFYGGCYGFNGDIPENCPSVKALEAGNCTTPEPTGVPTKSPVTPEPTNSPTELSSTGMPTRQSSKSSKSSKSNKSSKSVKSGKSKGSKPADSEEI